MRYLDFGMPPVTSTVTTSESEHNDTCFEFKVTRPEVADYYHSG